jgi:phage shock protein PspC (stress-responsive transcriptional regulator)
MDPTRCPYCAEEISPEALLCPHCRSHLARPQAVVWERDWPERRVAGVAAAVSRGLGLPLTPVRVAFVVLTFFHLIGALVYGALWAILPFRRNEESPLERGLGLAKDGVRRFRESVFHGGPAGPDVPPPSYNGVPQEPRA